MRALSFILAFAVILLGPPFWGSVDAGLPGPGTFSYNGSSLNAVAPPFLIAEAR